MKKIYTDKIILVSIKHPIFIRKMRMGKDEWVRNKKIMHREVNYGIIYFVCNNAESGEKIEYKQ